MPTAQPLILLCCLPLLSCQTDKHFEETAERYCAWDLACVESETSVEECTQGLIEENLHYDENGDDYRACKQELIDYFHCMTMTECDDSSTCDEEYSAILAVIGCEDWDS